MPAELPVVVLIAIVALVVASIVARRAAEHADRVAGRRTVAGSGRRGALGAVGDLLDQSVAAYSLRRRLGLSTRTRSDRRAADVQAAQVAAAEEIRRRRTGAPPPSQPTHLVVAGRHAEATPIAAPIRGSSTLRQELIVAVVGLLLVVALVIAIAPRGTGGVLSATGLPKTATDPEPPPTTTRIASPSPVSEGSAT